SILRWCSSISTASRTSMTALAIASATACWALWPSASHAARRSAIRGRGTRGASLLPQDGEDVETLLKKADLAMYRAKDMGRNTFQFYQPEMNASVGARLSLERRLRRALRDGEFLLHYQPQVDIGTGRIVGMEALVRWLDPDVGLVPPSAFIPVA